jgi:hypothetical protein
MPTKQQRAFSKLRRQPELESIESFATFLIDDDRETFTSEDLTKLSFTLHQSNHEISEGLKAYGLRLAPREPVRRVRGIRTSSNDRWYGPGSWAG